MIQEVTLDIETIPGQEDWIADYINEQSAEKIAKLSPPKNYKDQEKIDKWLQDKTDEINFTFNEQHEKLGFNGATNNIISIGVAVNSEEPVDYTVKTVKDEKSIIEKFFKHVEDKMEGKYSVVRLIGHNVVSFDITILKQRCMVLGITLPHWFPVNIKPWEDTVYDTMVQWGSYRDYIKLDLICRALGIEGKGSIDGSMVFPMFKEGRLEEIGKYCRSDITKTRNAYLRMNNRPIL